MSVEHELPPRRRAPGDAAPAQLEVRPPDEVAERASRDELARAELRPLGPDERPPALIVASVVSGLLAIGVIVGALTVHDLSKHGGTLPGAILLATVLATLAAGMARRSYWAVIGFEALLAFQILVTALALTVASTLSAATECVVAIGLGGWLFWKLVRVMGRIQAGEREEALR